MEDARELAETLAAARMLFTALAADLRYAAGPGARYHPWGAAVAELAELVPRTPSLIAAADPARAQHPLARTYLAAAVAVGLEHDLFPAIAERVHANARPWLLRDALDRIVTAAGTLQLFAERIRPLHAGTAKQVAAYAADVARTAAAAQRALPAPDAEAGARLLAGTTRLERTRMLIRGLPEPLRPGLGRLLVQARAFGRTAPPDPGALRGYSRVLHAGAGTVAAMLDQAGGSDAAATAAAWRAASEPWRRLQSELPNVATLGRRNPAVEATAADAVARLDMLRQLPSPQPASQRDRLLSDAAATGAVLREVSVHQRRLVDTLVRAGELYSPARLLSENDAAAGERQLGPRRWLPMPAAAAATLTAAYTEGTAGIAAAAERTGGHARGPRFQHQVQVALTTLEHLARSHAGTVPPIAAPTEKPRLRARPWSRRDPPRGARNRRVGRRDSWRRTSRFSTNRGFSSRRPSARASGWSGSDATTAAQLRTSVQLRRRRRLRARGAVHNRRSAGHPGLVRPAGAATAPPGTVGSPGAVRAGGGVRRRQRPTVRQPGGVHARVGAGARPPARAGPHLPDQAGWQQIAFAGTHRLGGRRIPGPGPAATLNAPQRHRAWFVAVCGGLSLASSGSKLSTPPGERSLGGTSPHVVRVTTPGGTLGGVDGGVGYGSAH